MWGHDWDENADGTTAGASATHAAATGTCHRITHISGHTDADSFIRIYDNNTSGAILWEVLLDVSLNGNSFAINIPHGVRATPGNAIVGRVETSTADCRVNISGDSIP